MEKKVQDGRNAVVQRMCDRIDELSEVSWERYMQAMYGEPVLGGISEYITTNEPEKCPHCGKEL